MLGALLVIVASTSLNAAESNSKVELMITNFSSDTPDLGWYVQNDNVMGGRSEGGFEQLDNTLIFAGSTNTRGGGFCSIRTRSFQLDLSGYDGIRLRVKGDGRSYIWQLQTDARWRGRRVSYWADIATRADEWMTVDMPFTSFVPQFRGYQLDGPDIDPGQITEMGLYINDTKDGLFELQVKSVDAYSGDAP